jgi:hypothetical protein
MEPLQTTSEVIDALGGTAEVAKLTGRSMQAVSNWRGRGFFTASVYLTITEALARKSMSANPALWRTVPPAALLSGAAA